MTAHREREERLAERGEVEDRKKVQEREQRHRQADREAEQSRKSKQRDIRKLEQFIVGTFT